MAAIDRALDLGINWIDTAAVYGFGHSEEVVGRALAGRREKPFVFTKCGLVRDADDREASCLKRDSIRREVEASLNRLGCAAIDLYQVHWPIPDEDIEEAWSALVELREEGLVHHIGASNFSVAQLVRAGAIAPVEALQPPYSLINRGAELELLPFCERMGIGVLVYSPMASGLLTGRMTRERIAGLPDTDWRKHDAAFTEPQLASNLAIAAQVGELAAELGAAPGAVATAWALHDPAVDVAIVGFRGPDQVEDLIGAGRLELGAADAAWLAGS